jgi:ABC-type Fe3+ transport system substrate-binding protein
MQQFPGIEVKVTGGFSNVLNEQIEKQMAEKKLAVDMAFFQTVQDFVNWKKQGKLLAFKPDGFDQIYPNFKDPDGAYMSLSANALTYAYNTAAVKPEDAPKSALDFLKPMFAGKMISVYPADDDAALYLFHLIVKKYGWDWMDKYMANGARFIQGHLGVQRSVSSGDNLVTVDSIFSITEGEKKAGKPVESHFSTIDPTPIWPLTGAVFKNAPHPNAAKLFLTWLLEPEQQAKVGTWSVRADVPPPAGFKPIFSYPVVNTYRAFMTDEAQIKDLRQRYERYTGPVVNTGGVR